MYLNNIFEQVPSADLAAIPDPNVSPAFLPPPDSNWTPVLQEENDDEQEEEDEDDDDEQRRPNPAGKRRKQELHRRHSKRYRDNLGELFTSLEHLLPKVVPGCKLKTKSQIIANSVSAIKHLRSEVSTLEIQYVLSGPTNRTKWVEDTVSTALCFQDVVEPFMRLLLTMQRWKHSELWSRHEMSILADGSKTGTPVSKPTESVQDLHPSSPKQFFLKLLSTWSIHDLDPALRASYQQFSEPAHNQVISVADTSLVGRVSSSLAPEVIDIRDSDSSSGFIRARAAQECGLVICFAVPFLVRGHVFAVVLFFDDHPRGSVSQDINVAQDLASSLGNCYGASSAHIQRGETDKQSSSQ
ncbi:GAF-like protein [Gracilaria domingensis]|nr:GAF-like protein [Gracilaria domingensis]